jgi:hypothetical protein
MSTVTLHPSLAGISVRQLVSEINAKDCSKFEVRRSMFSEAEQMT